jgi:hypothetical protein
MRSTPITTLLESWHARTLARITHPIHTASHVKTTQAAISKASRARLACGAPPLLLTTKPSPPPASWLIARRSSLRPRPPPHQQPPPPSMSSYENLSPQVITRIAREIQDLARKPAPGEQAPQQEADPSVHVSSLCCSTGRCGVSAGCVLGPPPPNLLIDQSLWSINRSVQTGIRLLQNHSESIAEIHAEIDGPGVCARPARPATRW